MGEPSTTRSTPRRPLRAATSLTPAQASAADVLRAYRRLIEVESIFRVLKDLLDLRPVFHWTESRARGHMGVCVLASVVEALMEADLRAVVGVDTSGWDRARIS